MEDARSYIGMPYGVSGMDCSGFTSAVFADFGVYLLDSPGAQYAYGTPSQGKAGDLCSSTSQATASPTSE